MSENNQLKIQEEIKVPYVLNKSFKPKLIILSGHASNPS